MCICVCHVHVCAERECYVHVSRETETERQTGRKPCTCSARRRQKKALDPEAEVTDSCEPSIMDAENQNLEEEQLLQNAESYIHLHPGQHFVF